MYISCTRNSARLIYLSCWMNEVQVKLSPTVAIKNCNIEEYIFIRKRNIPLTSNLNFLIPIETTIKFLGNLFDTWLSWRPHIEDLKKRCSSRMNLLKTINWKAGVLGYWLQTTPLALLYIHPKYPGVRLPIIQLNLRNWY